MGGWEIGLPAGAPSRILPAGLGCCDAPHVARDVAAESGDTFLRTFAVCRLLDLLFHCAIVPRPVPYQLHTFGLRFSPPSAMIRLDMLPIKGDTSKSLMILRATQVSTSRPARRLSQSNTGTRHRVVWSSVYASSLLLRKCTTAGVSS